MDDCYEMTAFMLFSQKNPQSLCSTKYIRQSLKNVNTLNIQNPNEKA